MTVVQSSPLFAFMGMNSDYAGRCDLVSKYNFGNIF